MDYDFGEFELLPFSVFHFFYHTSHNNGGELFICKF